MMGEAGAGINKLIRQANHPHVVWRFYLETGAQRGGGYRHFECNSEEDVDAFLAEHPGWRVMERTEWKEWVRRTDLEYGSRGK